MEKTNQKAAQSLASSVRDSISDIALLPIRIVDGFYQRLLLRIAQRRTFEGFTLYSVDGNQDFFESASKAIALLKDKSPVHYKRALCYMPVIAHVRQGVGYYKHAVRAFYVHQPSEDIPYFASEIVHESTHAYLRSKGYRYVASQRKRHEEICTRRQLAFIACVIRSQTHVTRTQQEVLIAQWKDWFKEHLASEWWHTRKTRQQAISAIGELLQELRSKKSG